mgnify:CR=1 FL=1
MSMATPAMIMQVANLVALKVISNFTEHQYTGNTARSVSVSYDPLTNEATVTVDPKMYDWYQLSRRGAVIPTGKGSYAQYVNKYGSKVVFYPTDKKGSRKIIYPRNHRHFAYECALAAAREFAASIGNATVRG